MAEAVAAPPGAAEVALGAALAASHDGDQPQARRILDQAIALAPGWDEPLLRRAELERHHGEAGAAMGLYRRALRLAPTRREALVALGVMLFQASRFAEAAEMLERATRCHPTDAEAWDALGCVHLAAGAPAAAHAAFLAAEAQAPGAVHLGLHRAEAALAAGCAEADLAALAARVAADPLDLCALAAQGALFARLGRWDESLLALETAIALAPDSTPLVLLHAETLTHARRLAEAEPALRRAIALAPERHALANDLAVVLLHRHRYAAAREMLEDLMARAGREAGLLCNLATVLAALGLQEAAVAAAQEAVASAPEGMTLPWRILAGTLPYRPEANGAALLAAAREAAARLPRPAQPPVFAVPADPDRPLRVGLLSSSFRIHPVGWLTVAGLEALDPAAFSLHVFAAHGNHDAMARRFRAIAAAWHDVDGLTDEALALGIRAAGIDVLIDLGGYGDGGRMQIAARRPAPVQIKWVGSQAHSSGIPEMDWFLTDPVETPPGSEPWYSERLLRLPHGYVCYSPPAYAPEVAPLPAVARGHVTFGCFNNLAKITPQVIAAWSRILHRLPGARLELMTQQFDEAEPAARFRAAFAAQGIGPARVGLSGSAAHRAVLAAYGGIDIVLDPFPYSGGLTTCEALWMGVPTIARPGDFFASRHSASHLTNLGLTDWIAPDPEAYEALAVARAGDLAALAALRAGLRARMRASPLCDARRFGRDLGAALRHAWREWCAATLA